MARRCLLFNVVIAACLMSGACVSDMHVNTHNMGVDAVESPAIGRRRVNIHWFSRRNTALDRGGLASACRFRATIGLRSNAQISTGYPNCAARTLD
jgi:hypothetical protein